MNRSRAAENIRLTQDYIWVPPSTGYSIPPDMPNIDQFKEFDKLQKKPNTFWRKLTNLDNEEKRQIMAVESFRRISYSDDDKFDDEYTPWTSECCAELGFFNISTRNLEFSIQCFYCMGKLLKRREGLCKADRLKKHDLIIYHRRVSPTCLMAQDICCGNLSMTDIERIPPINLSWDPVPGAENRAPVLGTLVMNSIFPYKREVAHPNQLYETERRTTLEAYVRRQGAHCRQNFVSDLANVGFFCPDDSSVFVCFWCGARGPHFGIITSLETLWKEHVKSVPSCPYVRLRKGTTFVLDCITEYNLEGDHHVQEMGFAQEHRRLMLIGRNNRQRFESFKFSRFMHDIKQQLSEAGYFCTGSTLPFDNEGEYRVVYVIECIYCGFRCTVSQAPDPEVITQLTNINIPHPQNNHQYKCPRS